MSLKLTNSLSKKKEPFIPIETKKIRIYCCGVTVYDLCHLGHARSYINWDVLRRFLIWEGNEVLFVQNFTDIDDKIINKAKEQGCSTIELAEKNIQEFHKDMDSLGILRPDRMPRATKCLCGIKSFISELEKKGAAYEVDGDVYFSVKKHLGYGKLSGREISEQQKNADGRISEKEAANKKNSFDFALWKKAKEGETSYQSPWGNGRPGWHIECSAMVREELGETIDIHLGGSDLIFPHHENEIAQSEAATGKPLANYWLHNGMVNVGGEKMSKSLGNFTTIRALLNNGISPMTLRFFILQAHYRKPLDFTEEALKSATKGWRRLNKYLSFGTIYSNLITNYTDENLVPENIKKAIHKFKQFMNDDLNTSAALSVIFDLAEPIRKFSQTTQKIASKDLEAEDLNIATIHWRIIVELSNSLGLKQENDYKKELIEDKELTKEIESLIKERENAKSIKNFIKSDQIRDKLKSLGVYLKDNKNGITTWEIKK